MRSFQRRAALLTSRKILAKTKEAELMGRDEEKIQSGETRRRKVSKRLLTVKVIQDRTC